MQRLLQNSRIPDSSNGASENCCLWHWLGHLEVAKPIKTCFVFFSLTFVSVF